MRIQTNILALNNQNSMKKNNLNLQKSTEVLSTGYRINRAADDTSGLAISEKLRTQIRSLDQGSDNIVDGINVAKTADSALAIVNDMLIRVNELSINAANEVKTKSDRMNIANEITQLYEEMDRIFETTTFNTIQLFRGNNLKYPDADFGYDEEITILPDGELVEWDSLDGLIDTDFDYASPAKGGSVTMTFDDSIDINDAQTLKDKTFVLGIHQYPYSIPFTFTESNLAGSTTVQDAMNNLKTSYPYTRYLEDIVVNEGDNSVTFTMKPTDTLEQSLVVDGETEYYKVEGGKGEATNGMSVSSGDTGYLNQVDGSSNTNNAPIYEDVVNTTSFQFMQGSDGSSTLSSSAIENLKRNTLVVGNHTITFGSGSGQINITPSMTVKELREAINLKINTFPDYSATIDETGNTIVSVENRSTTSATYLEIRETTSSPTYTTTTENIDGLELTIGAQTPATGETPAELEINIPSGITDGDEFAFTINGSTYMFHDFSKVDGDDNFSTHSRRNTNGKSTAEIQAMIRDVVASHLSSSTKEVTLDGNTISVKGKYNNQPLNISVGKGNGTIYHNEKTSDGSTKQLLPSDKNFSQNSSIPINLGNTITNFPDDIKKLNGSGFAYEGTWYEFSDSTAAASYPSAVTINTSGCNSFEDLKDAMATAIQSKLSDVKVTTDSNGKILITRKQVGAPSFTDGLTGNDGLFSNQGETKVIGYATGGTNAGKPQTIIDFSKYDSRFKLNDLLGTGFRVECATCPGEFINIMFCYDKTEAGFPDPDEFFIDDPNNPGEKIKIKNYVVEIKDAENGEDIVSDIYDQLNSTLTHYTGVEIGDPKTSLVIQDRRIGDIEDKDNGGIDRGTVLAGVYTNKIYTSTVENIPPTDASGGTGELEVPHNEMLIYTGTRIPNSTDEATRLLPFIPIRLPYLRLQDLNLAPPLPTFEDPDEPMETAKKASIAAATIATCRSRIGADHNRLEHADRNVTNISLQTSDAESRIRDADMAKASLENIKASLLQQTQFKLHAQIKEQSESILSLIDV